MDLLNILINPAKLKSTCFLCFKQNEETLSVFQKLYICDESQMTNTTLTAIMNYLFPAYDILFGQGCTNCSNFLLKAFLMLQKHNKMRDILYKITTILDSKVTTLKNAVTTSSKHYIKLTLPVYSEKRLRIKPEDLYSQDINKFNDKSSDFITDMKTEKLAYLCCTKCEMKFTSEQHLNHHEDMTHKSKHNAFICEFCGKDCKKPAALKVHLNCHNEKSCPYCFKILKSHPHYKVHIKNHEGNVKRSSRKSQYSCNICPYKSLNKNSLQAHVNKVHLRTRPFVCDICDKGFYKKSNLTEHVMIHNKVKNLTCDQCGDSFVAKKTLIAHLRLHSGERPFQCEICSLSFVTSGRRSDHFKRKHMEKTICCFVCDKKFSLKKELNSHMKKIHGRSKNTDEFPLIESNNLFSHHL